MVSARSNGLERGRSYLFQTKEKFRFHFFLKSLKFLSFDFSSSLAIGFRSTPFGTPFFGVVMWRIDFLSTSTRGLSSCLPLRPRDQNVERMLPEVEMKDFRKGSQWFTMKRQHAIIIMADSLYYSKFRDHCKDYSN